jgi:glutamine amidotransferase PdxT
MEIRKPEQLQNVTSLIIPGGESTTMAKLAEFHNLVSTRFFFSFFLLIYLLII